MDDQTEIFVVVDKNDKIIGYHTRYDCHHNKKLIHRGVGVVVFNKKGEILLQKRSKNKDTNPGFYDISSSGHVNKGESYKQAAKREMMEEIGVNANLRLESKFLLKLENETEMDVIFSTVHEGPFSISEQEVDEVQFYPVGEIKSMSSLLTPFAIESLERINIL